MTRRRTLVLAVAGAAFAILVGHSAVAAAGPRGNESETLRAFQRAKQLTDVLRGPFAERLRITDSRRIATYVDRRGRRATLYVAKTRTDLCQVLVRSSTPGGVGGAGGGCSPRAAFLGQARHVAASSGRLFAGVVANEVARVVIVGSKGVRHPVNAHRRRRLHLQLPRLQRLCRSDRLRRGVRPRRQISLRPAMVRS